MGLAILIHLFCFLHTGVIVESDSQGYIHWAREFARGNGFPGMIFRSPLYPFLVGLTFLAGLSSLVPIIIFQHGLLVLCVPGMYVTGRLSGCSQAGALYAALLFTVNSLIIQSAERVMTEALYLALLLSVFGMFLIWIKHPSFSRSILLGTIFSLIAYLRPGVETLLILSLLLLFLRWKKTAFAPASIVIAVFVLLIAPWSFRNLAAFQTYSLSQSLGIHLFTKAESYQLLDTTGTNYKKIERPLTGVLHDLKVTDESWKKPRENAWEINAVPHALKESLMRYHGCSYSQADHALAMAAFEGIKRHPAGYCLSILQALAVFVFKHCELYPSSKEIVPEKVAGWFSIIPKSMIRGFFYVPGILFVLFPFYLILKKKLFSMRIVPFLFGMTGLASVALVEIGLTRYTIPWMPFWIICVAIMVTDSWKQTPAG
jgi:acyl dehydratase